ncbi:hypothetical protein AVEN_256703-1 [Araneus ventricosus]|uniref:Uncharacterized protein n=1 Tax=Araneus ventricosus TaxID=182803 RepID=A0A4Y2EFK1_ARAVE|nr:hypothetical protein AVEN_256703-1 [Araneus ventricosus]
MIMKFEEAGQTSVHPRRWRKVAPRQILEEISIEVEKYRASNFQFTTSVRNIFFAIEGRIYSSAKIGKEKITVDPLTLFHRICVAKHSDEDLKMFFTFELSPFPLSLFNEEGMRKGAKSSLFSAFTPTKIDAVQGKNNFVEVMEALILHKVVWHRNMNFGDIAKSYLTYLQTHYGSNVAVVFGGYPSDGNGKSTKSA